MSKHDDIVRLWLESILSETGLTPSRLAAEAGLSPSTLTRYFNPDGPRHGLSSRSLSAIAERFGRDLPSIEGAETSGAGAGRPSFVEFMRNSPLLGVELDMSSREGKARQDAF